MKYRNVASRSQRALPRRLSAIWISLFLAALLLIGNVEHGFIQGGAEPGSPAPLKAVVDPFDDPFERVESSDFTVFDTSLWRQITALMLAAVVLLSRAAVVRESATGHFRTAPDSPRPPPLA